MIPQKTVQKNRLLAFSLVTFVGSVFFYTMGMMKKDDFADFETTTIINAHQSGEIKPRVIKKE